jgi:Zn-dependent oligopeptidase
MKILTQKFETKYNSAPFNQIKEEDYLPAFIKNIELARAEIDTIVNNSSVPTFENTIEALEFSGEKLDRLSSLFFNLNAAETNDEIQKIAQEVTPLLTEFSNDITLNFDLFKKIKSVFNNKENRSLTTEQNNLLDKKYKSFVRNGALLSEKEKEKLRVIDTELAKLNLTFGENVLAETNNYELHIKNETDLKGLPEDAKEQAAQIAKSKNKEGWIFTLDYPSFIPFVTYVENRDLRKELFIANGKKAFQNNEFNNTEIIKKIVTLRHQRANILGYPTHSHFILEERMAEKPEKVFTFLNQLLEKAKPAAQKEFNQLEKFAKKLDGIEKLERWDSAYYSEKLKQQLFRLDDEILKPYFKLENVLFGAFEVAKRLFGLHFKEIFDVEKYHSEVQTFEVTNQNGNLVSLFYTDFFPRKGKRNGAWMTSYKPQFVKNNTNERPHVSIVCNFTPPTKTKPSLLTFNEVTTLFHEFGHALHGMLANTTYPSLSGTSVFWDFVELPSQIMENWCYEPEALALFAKHYETNEIIPQEYINKIKESANFLEGLATLRQLSFGILDMEYHSKNETIENVKLFEKNTMNKTSFFSDIDENCMSTSFSHIFQGGYSSGYYSYKWAEVLDADAFAHFQNNGIFDSLTAQKFHEYILSKGGTEHPMVLYKKFSSKEPTVDALLKRAGLI